MHDPNIAGGTYTLKAALQGFKEFVQTGIPITAAASSASTASSKSAR